MIKNIIFDIGQVLAHFRWREYIEELGFSKEINERLANATVLSVNWNEVDRGVKTPTEFIELCISVDPEIEQQIRKFFEDTSNIVVEFDYSKDWLLELKKQGYHIYILSNYGEINYTHVKDKFTFLQYVDGAVISYQEKCIKPEKRIYEILLNRYQLNADECVFIDDLKANVLGAQEFGIHTIQFHNMEQAKKELGVLIDGEHNI